MKSSTLVLGTLFTVALSSVAIASPQTAGGNAQATAATTTDESTQPVGDTWITTKVKTELVAKKGVPGTDINVETVNGTVTLSGHVTKAQAKRAIAIAEGVKGVKNVDTSALVTDEAAHK
ncbi:BON domain-containing protein [Lysobacter sp. CA199]|uniref:BON domain-containing protein n=1 Tax=Lysobacter sp. CA199 TaxID=3455608 RepID=UPI003F8D1129